MVPHICLMARLYLHGVSSCQGKCLEMGRFLGESFCFFLPEKFRCDCSGQILKSRRRISSPRPPRPHRPSHRSLDVIPAACHTQYIVALKMTSAVLVTLWTYGFCSPGPVFHAYSSCNQRVGNVTRFLCFLPTATRLIASTSMGLYSIGVTPDGTSSTHTLPSFLSIDFSFFFLFTMCASFFLMNKSIPA